MKKFLLAFLLYTPFLIGQNTQPISVVPTIEFSYNEFLGYVKKYHPLVKNAQLELSRAQANLMQARGAFDPKIAVDFDKKQFKGKEYYAILNSSFKIPTWYGIELKAGFDGNEGVYLNPENTIPTQGLTALGITIPLAQGLLINQRMADVRKAKIQLKLSQAERKLQAVAVLYDASTAYFNWKKNYDEVQLYQVYKKNAQTRYQAICTLIKQGDKPAIDSIEASITIQNRALSLEDSQLKLTKAKLELSNFLWLENNIPLELADSLIPENKLVLTIQESLGTNELQNQNFSIGNHPKINALENKLDMLGIDKKLKANALLPRMDVSYSYIATPNTIDKYQWNDYKLGLNFGFPLFLRKERGALQLAQFKIQEAQYLLSLEKVQLTNKVNAQKTELESLSKQKNIQNSLVVSQQTMLQSEERLFEFGESSLFLLNTRENNLVAAQLAAIGIENRWLLSNADLFKIKAMVD